MVFVPGSATINGLSLSLTELGYALQFGSSAPIPITFSGQFASPSNPGGTWSPIAAAALASGYDLYWKNGTSGQFARWTLNSAGALSSSAFLSLAEVFAAESSLNADLTADGSIGIQQLVPPPVTLYNASATSLPSQQGWLAFGTGLTGTQTRSFNGTTFNSTALVNDLAGYSNTNTAASLVNTSFPQLDRSVGFNLDFGLRVISETHSVPNRAGFSVTLLDRTSTPQGIELGFWTNSIFSQTGGATPFQTVAERLHGVDTTLATTYSLRILDNVYYLLGGNRLLLSGSVQSYNLAAKDPRVPYNPYVIPNFLFLGDNTGSASASVELGTIALDAMRTGTIGADAFTGSALADAFNGLAGADSASGGDGNDWLAGGPGADTLNGQTGDDFLIGGSEADRFLFNSGATFNTTQLGVDTIVDFNATALDRIRLARTTFTALPAGTTLAATTFATVSTDALAATSTAPIVYNSATGRLFYNPNGSAAGFAPSETAGGAFAQLWGGATGTPFPALTNGVFEIG
jgi:hypothetical protein